MGLLGSLSALLLPGPPLFSCRAHLSTMVMTALNLSNPVYPPKACGPIGRWWNIQEWDLVEEVIVGGQ